MNLPGNRGKRVSRSRDWISVTAWICVIILVALVIYLALTTKIAPGTLNPTNNRINTYQPKKTAELALSVDYSNIDLPKLQISGPLDSIPRHIAMDTIIPDRKRREILEYNVEFGDSVFGIAEYHHISPETVLWSNYDVLKDNPHALSPGMVLKIPPINGVFYEVKENDTLDSIAEEFEANVNDVLNWSANRLDLAEPQIHAGMWLIIPDGKREFQQWIIPTIPRGSSGVSAGVYGSGVCPGGYTGGLYGSGAFIWPSTNHTLSGNDYWSGHLAIDIGTAIGESILASDSGVVVFAGWATGGYGNVVAIDHGNGYQTLYAHLSQVSVVCGQSVNRGRLIGLGGSTGNSTGPHLHFEIRYQGGFVNPWYVLPAP